MAGKIYIVGEVMEWSWEASLQHVRNELARHSSESEIEVYIHSPGGDVYEGVAMYNELKNSGKKIKTYGQGLVGSIATLLLLVADKENRHMMPLTEFFIHNPWGFTIGDAKEHEQQAKGLRQIEDSIAQLYFKETGGVLSLDEIKELMDKQTFISAEDAVKYGFASEITQTTELVQNSLMMMSAKNQVNKLEIKNRMANLKTMLAGMLGGKKALTITTAEDGTVTVEGVIEVGEVVTVDGEPAPDGEHTFEGVTFITEGGVITEIVEAEESEEVLTADAVQAMIDAAISAQNKKLDEMQDGILEIGKAFASLRNSAPNHKPVQKTNKFSSEVEDDKKVSPEKLAEIRAKIKNNKK